MADQLADGRQLNLLRHPFDQYQRYQDIRVAVDVIRQHEQKSILKVLDVGGTALSKRFLASDDVLTVNLEPNSSTQVGGDGSHLPFENDRFDVVITVDTLEYVPPEHRQTFITELLRVSRAFVSITGPFSSGYKEIAEETLYEFLTTQLGVQHRFLREHLENGLPDLEAIHRMLCASTEVISIPSGYIQHWLPLMLIKHILLSITNGEDVSHELDQYYNYACYRGAHRIPSHRHLLVAAKSGHTDALELIRGAFKQLNRTETPDLNGVLAMWQALRWQTILRQQADAAQQQQAEIAHLRNESQLLTTRVAQLQALQAENRRLASLVTGYESGRFIRFMAALKQLQRAVRRV
jgi:hypothetical protein